MTIQSRKARSLNYPLYVLIGDSYLCVRWDGEWGCVGMEAIAVLSHCFDITSSPKP